MIKTKDNSCEKGGVLMKTLKLTAAICIILMLAAGQLFAQGAAITFRTGDFTGWCPIMAPGGHPTGEVMDGAYVMILMDGGNATQDPVQTGGVPGGDDVQPTGNNIDHIIVRAVGEPPFVPPGNFYSVNTILGFLDPGLGTEPCANIGDMVYLRAFNTSDPATATHANDMNMVNGVTEYFYTPPGTGPGAIIVCFGDAYPFGAPPPCVPQEAAGPEAASIPMGSTHYFFGETEQSHCTLWIYAYGGLATLTEALLVDAEPPCQPYPATNYMTRYFELWGTLQGPVEVNFGYSQTDYDASDFGAGQETMMHVAWYDGSVAACDGEWVKTYPIPANITDTPEGGYATVDTDHLSLWSFGWDGGETQLPVELISFEALAGDRSAVLNWTTASETDNDGFYIERSTDGENFVRVSQLIEGAGTSSNSNDYTYTDTRLNNGVHYTYRLIDVDINGIEYINEMTAEVMPSFLGEAIVITEYKLHQNYPNPFNPSTNLVYDVLEQGMVTLKVYNVMGQEVAQLVNQPRENGRYAVSFDATGLSSGIYFYTVKVNNFTDTKKMLLVQ
jgi:hypothetical protein